MGWGFRIEWDQSVGDKDSIATAVMKGHVTPNFAWSQDDRIHVYRITTTSHDLLSEEAAALLAHQLATKIRSEVNEQGGAGPQLPEPSIKVFRHVSEWPLDDETIDAGAAPPVRRLWVVWAVPLVIGVIAAIIVLAVRLRFLH
jgi:hypothetical protein